jgi:hypothetical protein
MYGVGVSPDLISRVTDAVHDDVAAWQSRPLDSVYCIVYLAPHLPKPREAKKTLHNLLAAPGTVAYRATSIGVRLRPAATRAERMAFAVLLRGVNARRLTLPGDPQRRTLRFSVASS